MTTTALPSAGALADRLRNALAANDSAMLSDLSTVEPIDLRDRFTTLLTIYDLHTAPIERLGGSARFQHDPAVAAIKQRCEAGWLSELEALQVPDGIDSDDAVAAMRAIAARDRLPAVYKWLARDAAWEQVVDFLAIEGGPDAGFDDLVAACQIGLTGAPKMELATNYWDEMGNGDLSAVHTTLHDDLVAAIGLPTVPLGEQPVSALARNAFCKLLATNRWLQPEMLGALGLIELQAGPRCRLVLQAFDRCGAPAAAYPFYEVHADVDPRHGKDWLDKAVAPVVAGHPDWAPRIVRGALWRSAVNADFLDEITAELMPGDPASDETEPEAA